MRLSEAIRLGSMLHPQFFGSLIGFKGGQRATCALGAAREAGFLVSEGPDRYGSIENDADEFARVCPHCRSTKWQWTTGPRTLARLIQHLNDHHRWTREQIAEFVESQETAGEPSTTSVEDVKVQA